MRLVELKHIDGEQLDEMHPMTRMMLNAMGEKDPEAKYEKKKKKVDNKKKQEKKKVAEGEEAKNEKCRGCGTEEPGARVKGLCKDCAKDTYEDKD